MSRWGRIGLVSAVVSSVAIAGVIAYKFNSLTRARRVKIKDDPSALGLKYEDVSFPATIDAVALSGWYIKAKRKSKRCIIMTHSGGFHRADATIGMLEIAKALTEHGYDVLMYDLRGHGESGNARMTAGFYERRDVQGAIDFVRERGIAPQSIGLLGFSMGAASSLLAAAEDRDVPAVVSDSCWAELRDLIRSEIARRPYIPGFLTPLMPKVAKLAYRFDIDEASPIDAVAKIAPRPVFFIHGEFDRTVPVESAMRLYHSIDNPNNRLWVVPEAPHVGSYRAQPEEYIAKVTDFMDQALKQASSRRK
ncbi:MAG: alpha/beta hydrolase [Dehalococcoidia bacterium]|nr:MAG: alpha/beta hydrolase [Dehalococcoidia bacterium]UCG84138.1 MAG: alpha/beta hydrolase [Dehalococcoidia bacterium]